MHAAFAAAAGRDGIELRATTFDWLGEQGHVGLERVAKARRDPALVAPCQAAIALLADIYARLRGDEAVLWAARTNLLLPVQHQHPPSGTVVELTGREHFTTARLDTLSRYPSDAALGFDVDVHRDLCRELAAEADATGRGLPAKGFGLGGAARERAYHDALRDLATPAMGLPPLVRVVVLDGDGEAAYERTRDRLAALRGSA